MGDAQVGDSLKLKVVDRYGQDKIKRLIVTGIARSPGGQGLDYNAIMHIDTLRDMMDRDGYTGSIMVKIDNPEKSIEIKNLFLQTFPHQDFIAETIEEAAEQQLAGFRSGIAMINMIGYF